MIINHNMNAINAHRQMGINVGQQGKSIEKLSSGLRINRAGDDAAGLAISEKMRGQIRGLDQAARNSQDGISMIQTAEGALNETHSILQRMRELAVQAANDTNASQDRKEIQNEINQLTSEINRIGNTTEFNTQKVLDGGASVAKGTPTTVPTMTTTTSGVAGSAAGAAKVTGGVASAVTGGATFKLSVDGGSAVTITLASGATGSATAAAINTAMSGKVTASVNASGKIEIVGKTTGSAASINISSGTGQFSKTGLTAGTTNGTAAGGGATQGVYEFNVTALQDGEKYSIDGTELDVTGKDGTAVANSLKKAIEDNATLKAKYDVTITGDKVTLTQKTGQESATAPDLQIASNSQFKATLQIGANKGQSFEISINDMRSEALGISQKSGTGGAATTPPTVNTTTKGVAGSAAGAAKVTGGVASAVTGGATFKLSVDGGSAVTITLASGATGSATAAAINTAMSGKVTASVNASGKIEIVGKTTGSAASINISSGTGQFSKTGLTAGTTNGTAAGGGATQGVYEFNAAALQTGESYVIDNKELNVTGKTGAEVAKSLKSAIDADATLKNKYDVVISGDKVTLTQKTGQESATAPDVQIGSAGAVFTTAGAVTNGTDATVTEAALDVSNFKNATNAIDVINTAINTVSTERSKLGGYQNRLEHTINNLGTSSENLTAAESRIRDVDMAKEMMTQSKNSILAQAAQAMLAQANQQPQGVLQLLG